MASRYPLVLDEASGRLRELPNGDDLNLAGNNITGLISLTTTGGITVGGSLNVSGESNANVVQATTGNITNINATTLDAQTITINGAPLSATQIQSDWDEFDLSSPAYILNKPPIPQDVADLTDNDNLLSGGFSGDYNDLTNLPLIPTDVQDLTDNNNLLKSDISELTDNFGIILSQFTQLTDAPDTYVGQADKILTVNVTETGIGFVDAALIPITLSQVTNALGYTPYNGTTNPDGYINLNSLSGTGDITYDSGTGQISFNNSSGYLTAEADTLQTVTTRGGATTNTITAAGFSTAGTVSAASATLTGDLSFNSTQVRSIDTQAGGTVRIGGQGDVILNAFNSTTINSALLAGGINLNIGSVAQPFQQVYANTVSTGSIAPTGTNFSLELTGAGSTLTLGATRKINFSQGGTVGMPTRTRAQLQALAAADGEMAYNSEDRMMMTYISNHTGVEAKWVQLNIPFGSQPNNAIVHTGMLAIADGSTWDPTGVGDASLMIYLDGAWQIVF